jgi:hypothetical protein
MEKRQMDQGARRSFLSAFGAALGVLGFGAGSAAAQSAPASFTPPRHKDDEWLNEIPGKHRVVIDATLPGSAGAAALYAGNLFNTNKSAYGLTDKDLAIVIVMRHNATPFAFNDALWSKYGKALGQVLDFTDPHTKQAPSTNLYNAKGYGLALTNLGTTISSVTERGAVIAICDLATHFASSGIARVTGAKADDIYADFKANPLPNGRFVSAGVNAVTRAQELGYTLIYAG